MGAFFVGKARAKRFRGDWYVDNFAKDAIAALNATVIAAALEWLETRSRWECSVLQNASWVRCSRSGSREGATAAKPDTPLRRGGWNMRAQGLAGWFVGLAAGS